jgi:chemotaxis protein CheZ
MKIMRQTIAPNEENLVAFVQKVDGALRELAPVALAQRRLPSAKLELEAARNESGDAALRIIDAVERLLALADTVGGDAGRCMNDVAGDIFEACAMHDIVGQRLTKASGAFDLAGLRLGNLASRLNVPDVEEPETEASLLATDKLTHGPALGGPETSQADIDAVFAN